MQWQARKQYKHRSYCLYHYCIIIFFTFVAGGRYNPLCICISSSVWSWCLSSFNLYFIFAAESFLFLFSLRIFVCICWLKTYYLYLYLQLVPIWIWICICRWLLRPSVKPCGLVSPPALLASVRETRKYKQSILEDKSEYVYHTNTQNCGKYSVVGQVCPRTEEQISVPISV